jgi:hypothetical protein
MRWLPLAHLEENNACQQCKADGVGDNNHNVRSDAAVENPKAKPCGKQEEHFQRKIAGLPVLQTFLSCGM